MIVLGVDPGTYICGYGLIKNKDNEIELVDSGFISQPKNLSFPVRLRNLYDHLCKVISVYNPDEMSIEDTFVSKNPRSTMKLGEARGVAMLAAAVSDIPVFEYSPTEVKASVTGNGRSSKAEVQRMIFSILDMDRVTLKTDASDAIAIAICHIHNTGLYKKYGFSIRKKSAKRKRFNLNDITS